MLIPVDSEASLLGIYTEDRIQNYEKDLLSKYVHPSSKKSGTIEIAISLREVIQSLKISINNSGDMATCL